MYDVDVPSCTKYMLIISGYKLLHVNYKTEINHINE